MILKFVSIERKKVLFKSYYVHNLNSLTEWLHFLTECHCPEQHRIVVKIEELFSSLDKGIESLKTAQAQLKTYRQAVLKWAFEGKLTEEWRRENSRGDAENAEEEGELPKGWKWVKMEILLKTTKIH